MTKRRGEPMCSPKTGRSHGRPYNYIKIGVKMMKELYYKTEDNTSMLIKLYKEDGQSEKSPLIVFFFGGGWMGGTVDHFENQAKELSKLGYIVANVDYRVFLKHGTSFDVAMKDSFYSIKYLSDNADELGIDCQNVFFGGGSAGGHLAISCIMFNNVKHSFSVRGLLSFNAVIDTTEAGFMSEASTSQAFNPIIFSPFHSLRENLPAMIIFHGTADTVMPYARVVQFVEKYKALGNEIYLESYENEKHGFFSNPNCFEDSLEKAKIFIKEHLI